jgi:spore germination protein GerM
MKRRSFILIILIVAALGAGIYAYMFAGYKAEVAPSKPLTKSVPVNTVPQKNTERTVLIYMIGVDGDKTVLKPVDVTINADDEPIQATLQAFIDQQNTADLGNPIPEGSRIESVKVDGDLATINFNKEFVDGFAGGSEDESLLIKAIVKTVGQFDNINKIMLKADGKPVNTLGHLDITEPIVIDDTGN